MFNATAQLITFNIVLFLGLSNITFAMIAAESQDLQLRVFISSNFKTPDPRERSFNELMTDGSLTVKRPLDFYAKRLNSTDCEAAALNTFNQDYKISIVHIKHAMIDVQHHDVSLVINNNGTGCQLSIKSEKRSIESEKQPNQKYSVYPCKSTTITQGQINYLKNNSSKIDMILLFDDVNNNVYIPDDNILNTKDDLVASNESLPKNLNTQSNFFGNVKLYFSCGAIIAILIALTVGIRKFIL